MITAKASLNPIQLRPYLYLSEEYFQNRMCQVINSTLVKALSAFLKSMFITEIFVCLLKNMKLLSLMFYQRIIHVFFKLKTGLYQFNRRK